jgi:hypothetical protein
MIISIAASFLAAKENQDAIKTMSNSICIDLFVDYYSMGITA